MSCSCRKYAAWLSRSAKIATSTLAPVTSSRPDDCTWMTARWMTRWKPAVGLESSLPSLTRFSSSDSRYAARLRRSFSRSTLQARITAAASWSSIKASSRCSRVAYSWCRSLASARARWRDCSRLREKVGIVEFLSSVSRLYYMGGPLLLFHDALQRMLVFAGKVHNLRHFGFRHLIGVDSALADAVLVHVHHDTVRRLVVLVEEFLQHVDHELHRRVVVVEQEHAVEARPLGLRAGLADHRGPRRSGVATALALVVGQTGRARTALLGRHPFQNSRSHGLSTCLRDSSSGYTTIIRIARVRFQMGTRIDHKAVPTGPRPGGNQARIGPHCGQFAAYRLPLRPHRSP